MKTRLLIVLSFLIFTYTELLAQTQEVFVDFEKWHYFRPVQSAELRTTALKAVGSFPSKDGSRAI
jgi:hypothetical protein